MTQNQIISGGGRACRALEKQGLENKNKVFVYYYGGRHDN